MPNGGVAERRQPHDLRFRDLARQLLDAADRSEFQQATALTFQTLREHLAPRFGPVGYDAILKRAIRLTESSFPVAWALGARADGTLQGIDVPLREFPLDAVREEVVDVLAHALGLIATFVGDDLTLRIVQTKWPNVVLQVEGDAREDMWC